MVGKSLNEFSSFRLSIEGQVPLPDQQLVPVTPNAFETFAARPTFRVPCAKGRAFKAVWPDFVEEDKPMDTSV
jgi:hypothetical protein